MTRHTPAPARLPPRGLPELDPDWSRLVTTNDADGHNRTWHVLDSGAQSAEFGTVLCLHGNPTWSYLWRRLVAEPPPGWRVVAPDQLGMGYSERLDAPRTFRQRIGDLADLTSALGIDGPVVILAHDWGGPISLGWAEQHVDQLAGIVLTNTAVHQPAGSAAPTLIRLARSAALRGIVCVQTPMFIRGATAVSRPHPPRETRAAFAAPYGGAASRAAVGDFVADIPLEPDHPSMTALESVRDGLAKLAGIPALALWGPRDPVFTDRHLQDLLDRLPLMDVHRYVGASHLVTEDRPQAFDAIRRWIGDLPAEPRDQEDFAEPGLPQTLTILGSAAGIGSGRPLWAALDERADDSTTAIIEHHPIRPDAVTTTGMTRRDVLLTKLAPKRHRVSFEALATQVRDLASGLPTAGVRPGDRVALLMPPGADLATAVYACWRAGAVVVIADAGLGLAAMGRALRGAGPDHVIGIPRALAATQLLRIPGQRILAGQVGAKARRVLRVAYTVDEIVAVGRDEPLPPSPADDEECAVLFTSGATGPPKGVVYRHRQAQAQLDAIRLICDIRPGDALVAAFAPFALYGPLLGIATAIPDVDVTAPARLSATALAEAVASVKATLVFASPSALRNVVATSQALAPRHKASLRQVRLVLSAGAPVSVDLLRAVRDLMPAASLHTPYGMTEVLPVTDIELDEIEAVGPGNGVCVGRPIAGVDLAISPLADDGTAPHPPTDLVDVTGEVCVRARHVKDRYDRLWATEREAARDPGWHRTGDVGHLDVGGRLWIEGRLAHVVVRADGVVTPVGVEQRVGALDAVRTAAVVGVGPRGTQQLVVVVVPRTTSHGLLADDDLAAQVRAAAERDVAAVLTTNALPVDVRHQSKIDRRAVAEWAEHVLAGGRVRRQP